jgi:hypothetical protein
LSRDGAWDGKKKISTALKRLTAQFPLTIGPDKIRMFCELGFADNELQERDDPFGNAQGVLYDEKVDHIAA